jgi:hypothetical protein
MKKLLAATVVGGVLLLTACGGNPKVSGDVVNKDFTPAHSESYMIPQYMTTCHTVNGSTSCTQHLSGYLPATRFVKDDYDIQVRDRESDKLEWVDVTKTIYDSLELGAYFTNEENN